MDYLLWNEKLLHHGFHWDRVTQRHSGHSSWAGWVNALPRRKGIINVWWVSWWWTKFVLCGVEFKIVKCRPYFLPREFTDVVIVAVYLRQPYICISDQQTAQPGLFFIMAGCSMLHRGPWGTTFSFPVCMSTECVEMTNQHINRLTSLESRY